MAIGATRTLGSSSPRRSDQTLRPGSRGRWLRDARRSKLRRRPRPLPHRSRQIWASVAALNPACERGRFKSGEVTASPRARSTSVFQPPWEHLLGPVNSPPRSNLRSAQRARCTPRPWTQLPAWSDDPAADCGGMAPRTLAGSRIPRTTNRATGGDAACHVRPADARYRPA